ACLSVRLKSVHHATQREVRAQLDADAVTTDDAQAALLHATGERDDRSCSLSVASAVGTNRPSNNTFGVHWATCIGNGTVRNVRAKRKARAVSAEVLPMKCVWRCWYPSAGVPSKPNRQRHKRRPNQTNKDRESAPRVAGGEWQRGGFLISFGFMVCLLDVARRWGNVITFENALTRHYVETEQTVRDGFRSLQAVQVEAAKSY